MLLIGKVLLIIQGFPDGWVVKNQPVTQETQETRVRFLCGEDPLEEGMTTHSSVLAGRIPWTEEPGRLQSMGSQRVRHDWATRRGICTSFHGYEIVHSSASGKLHTRALFLTTSCFCQVSIPISPLLFLRVRLWDSTGLSPSTIPFP